MRTYIAKYKDGTNILHSKDGPAVIEDTRKRWIQNSLYHRENGPAIMYLDTKICEWWINGNFIIMDKISDKQFMEWWDSK